MCCGPLTFHMEHKLEYRSKSKRQLHANVQSKNNIKSIAICVYAPSE